MGPNLLLKIISLINIAMSKWVKWCEVRSCGVSWRDKCEVILLWSEVKWVTLKFLGAKVTRTLEWPYIEGTWLYCDYFIWGLSCTVVVLICFVLCVCMCGFCNVWVLWQLCGCFGNMCTFIYCVFVLFRFRIFILTCY